jgi:diketogulonate reductase-like aldo/keto reductase
MPDTAQAAAAESTGTPTLLYGTAWKEDATQRLTALALEQGFRGIDTANQRRHYHEAAVGEAIAASIAVGVVRRGDLFLQTKFTFRQGQDDRLPYDSAASIATQVKQSFASSLEHLKTETIDSYLLHGPSTRSGLTADDWAAWEAIETIHDEGLARWIGISNVDLSQLELLCRRARTGPHIVQNRCYAVRGWDGPVRRFCAANGIRYQGFSLLTANREVLSRPELQRIAERYDRSPSQIVFRFAIDMGMTPLTGTTSVEHMRADLDVVRFRLEPAEVQFIETLGVNKNV